MDKINWKAKLTSRKLWLAVAGLVTGVITLLKPGTDTTQISGVILALGSVIVYIVGEGLVDAAAAGTVPDYTGQPVETLEDVGAEGKGNPTGSEQAAEVKQTTAGLSGQDTAAK